MRIAHDTYSSTFGKELARRRVKKWWDVGLSDYRSPRIGRGSDSDPAVHICVQVGVAPARWTKEKDGLRKAEDRVWLRSLGKAYVYSNGRPQAE